MDIYFAISSKVREIDFSPAFSFAWSVIHSEEQIYSQWTENKKFKASHGPLLMISNELPMAKE